MVLIPSNVAKPSMYLLGFNALTGRDLADRSDTLVSTKAPAILRIVERTSPDEVICQREVPMELA